MAKRKNADLAMRLRLMANRIDPESPSRDFPPAWEMRDLLNDAARALEGRLSKQEDRN
jgi:hypothetical protein